MADLLDDLRQRHDPGHLHLSKGYRAGDCSLHHRRDLRDPLRYGKGFQLYLWHCKYHPLRHRGLEGKILRGCDAQPVILSAHEYHRLGSLAKEHQSGNKDRLYAAHDMETGCAAGSGQRCRRSGLFPYLKAPWRQSAAGRQHEHGILRDRPDPSDQAVYRAVGDLDHR